MTALNQLIAASGEKFYENMRKGWHERPEEARQRGLEELRLSGMGQEQELRGLQIGSEKAKAEEYEAGALGRKQARDRLEATTTEEAYAKKDAEVAEQTKLEQARMRSETQKNQAMTEQAKSVVAKAEQEGKIKDLAQQSESFAPLISAIYSFTSVDDIGAADRFVQANKQKLLDIGDDETDAQVLAFLDPATPPEQKKEFIEGLYRANSIIAKELRERETKATQAEAKAKAKGATKLTPKLLTNPEVETKMEVLLNKDPRIEGSGTFGELSADETAEFKTDVISLAKQLMEAVAKGGVMLDHSQALEDAYERVSQLVIKNPDAMSTNEYTYKRLKK